MTRKKTPHKYLYKLNNEVLNVVSKYPYLGVEIQDDLNWHTHIQKICSKANKVLGLLKRNISSCSPATKSLAYLSLVRPCVEYASSVWDPFLQKHINELEQIQRRSGRFVYSDYRRSSSASAMLHKLHWPTLQSRRTQARLMVFYKAVNGLIAVPVDHLRRSSRVTRETSGSAVSFTRLSSKCNTYKNSFFCRTITDWNKLGHDIRIKPSPESYKSALEDSVLVFY